MNNSKIAGLMNYLSDCLPTTIGETVTYNIRTNYDYRTQKCRL